MLSQKALDGGGFGGKAGNHVSEGANWPGTATGFIIREGQRRPCYFHQLHKFYRFTGKQINLKVKKMH